MKKLFVLIRKGELETVKELIAKKPASTLEKIIGLGANVKAQDSYGNHCLNRACLDARQFNWKKDDCELKEMKEDLQKVFHLLIRNGADIHEKTATRDAVVVAYGHEPFARMFNLTGEVTEIGSVST